MSMCWSASERGFFVKSIHGSGMPSDCISITDAEYAELMRRQSEGWEIRTINGRPQAVQPPPTDPNAQPTSITALEFRRRFTMQERGRITAFAVERNVNGDPTLQVFLDDLASAGVVDLNDPETVQGVEYCVGMGLITPKRADAILGR